MKIALVPTASQPHSEVSSASIANRDRKTLGSLTHVSVLSHPVDTLMKEKATQDLKCNQKQTIFYNHRLVTLTPEQLSKVTISCLNRGLKR